MRNLEISMDGERAAENVRGAAPIAVPPLRGLSRSSDQCTGRPRARTTMPAPVKATTAVSFRVGLQWRIALTIRAGLADRLVARNVHAPILAHKSEAPRDASIWH